MAEYNQSDFELPGFNGRKIEGNFEGGNVGSDGVWSCCRRSIAGLD